MDLLHDDVIMNIVYHSLEKARVDLINLRTLVNVSWRFNRLITAHRKEIIDKNTRIEYPKGGNYTLYTFGLIHSEGDIPAIDRGQEVAISTGFGSARNTARVTCPHRKSAFGLVLCIGGFDMVAPIARMINPLQYIYGGLWSGAMVRVADIGTTASPLSFTHSGEKNITCMVYV